MPCFYKLITCMYKFCRKNLAAPISFPIFDFGESAVHRGWSRVVTPLDDYGRAAPI